MTDYAAWHNCGLVRVPAAEGRRKTTLFDQDDGGYIYANYHWEFGWETVDELVICEALLNETITTKENDGGQKATRTTTSAGVRPEPKSDSRGDVAAGMAEPT